MGTLLVIPPTRGLDSLRWQTPQGRVLARCAQEYGLYVGDDVATSDSIGFAMDSAAGGDVGLVTAQDTGFQQVDPSKLDAAGFLADVLQVLASVQAVSNNHP
jgi:hypothetical protein